jgi:two-component system OmpR family sensor kinase
MKSFSNRLAARATATMTVALVVIAVLTYGAVRETLDSQVNASLLNVASIQAASVTDAPSGAMRFHEWDLTPAEAAQVRELNRFAQIWTEDGKSILRTRYITEDLPLDGNALRVAARGDLTWSEQEFQGFRIRSLYYPLARFGPAHGRHVLQVAAPLDTRDRMLKRLVIFMVGVIGLVSAMMYVGSSWLAKRAVRPVAEIIAQSREIGGGTIDRRISAYADSKEYRGLVEVLNTMLDRLEDAFQAQRRFTADASHELRSPLTALRGELELARRRKRSPDEYERTIDSALEEVERLSRITEDLLTLARSDAGVLVLRPESVDLGAAAQEVVARLQGAATMRDVQIQTESAGDTLLRGDPDLLKRLIWNLVGNAVKFTPRGGQVSVRVDHADEGVRLHVADTGPGIPPDQVEHIFDRFYQINPVRTGGEADSGTGLGLAIARAIADLHSASIDVTNERTGALFTVVFPRPHAQG